MSCDQQIAFDRAGDSLYLSPSTPGDPVVRYDLATGEVAELDLHQGDQAVIPFAPVDDRHVVHSFADGSGGPEPMLRLVDTETGAVVATADLRAPPAEIALNPSGDRLAVTTFGSPSRASTVEVFDVPSLVPISTVSQPGPIFDGTWSSVSAWVDDDRIAIGSPTGRIMIWRATTAEVVLRLNDPPVAGDVATELRGHCCIHRS